MPAATTFHQLLHYMALLVALYWEYSLIPSCVGVVVNCLFKGLVEVRQSVFKNIVKTDQQGQ